MKPRRTIAEFTVDGRPVPCPRPRVTRDGKHTYNPARYETWRTECGLIASVEMDGTPVTCDVALLIRVRVPDKRHGDLDNYVKAVGDALEGVVFENDKQVKRIEAELCVGEAPGVDVVVQTCD
jgi:crossover junction endodeoxyribonuclease RusA